MYHVTIKLCGNIEMYIDRSPVSVNRYCTTSWCCLYPTVSWFLSLLPMYQHLKVSMSTSHVPIPQRYQYSLPMYQHLMVPMSTSHVPTSQGTNVYFPCTNISWFQCLLPMYQHFMVPMSTSHVLTSHDSNVHFPCTNISCF